MPLAALLTVALQVAMRVVVTLVARLMMLTMNWGSPQPAAARGPGRDAHNGAGSSSDVCSVSSCTVPTLSATGIAEYAASTCSPCRGLDRTSRTPGGLSTCWTSPSPGRSGLCSRLRLTASRLPVPSPRSSSTSWRRAVGRRGLASRRRGARDGAESHCSPTVRNTGRDAHCGIDSFRSPACRYAVRDPRDEAGTPRVCCWCP